MASKYLIYGLIDPRNGELRYVGKSCSGLKRPKSHTYPGVLRRSCVHSGNWLKGLVSEGLRPEIEVLEECLVDELSEAEIFWIAYFRFLGCRLTNHTAGGEGGQLGVKFDDQRKLKISEGHGGAARKREEVLCLYASGLSTRVVAKTVGIGSVTVFKYVVTAGLLRDRQAAHAVKGDRVLTKEEERQVVELYASGLSGEEIKHRLKIPNNKTVSKIVKSAGVGRSRAIASRLAWQQRRVA